MDAIFPILGFLVIGGFFFGIFALIFLVGRNQRKKLDNQFQLIAGKFGGEVITFPKKLGGLIHPYPKITGALRGTYPYEIYTYTTGSGKNRTTWTAIRLYIGGTPDLKWKISREHLFTKIGKALGMSDIEIGDEAFDKKFLIKSNDEQYIRRLLTPSMMQKFLDTWNKHGLWNGIEVDKCYARYYQQGLITSDKMRNGYEAVLELMLAIIDENEGSQHGGMHVSETQHTQQ